MQLSKKDLDIIFKYVSSRLYGDKLSEFPIADALSGEEIAPIVQNEQNRNVRMKDLLSLPQLVEKFRYFDHKADSDKEELLEEILESKSELDEKYNNVTNELYSMIASLQVSGIALSQKFGYREDIGISQKTLTKAIGRLWEELGTITGKTYMDYTLTVEPSLIYAEGAKSVVVTTDCSESISDFDSIKIYLNGELKAESHDVTRFTTNLSITETSVIRAEGVIMGKSISKETRVSKYIPFLMGSGQDYQEVMVPENLKELIGTLEGDYDLTVKHDGDYMFIIIPISHKDEFRRADMNGLGIKIEIPMASTTYDDYVVYKSLNTYKAGTYNIDIDINS